MNLGSWIVLAIVVAIVALAIRSTFFKKDSGCCGHAGDGHTAENPSGNCGDCASCHGCPAHENCLQPTIREL